MGLGMELLAAALQRCLAASEIARIRGIVAHAINNAAVGFYQRHSRSRLSANARCCCRSRRLGHCLKINHGSCLGRG
jgi:hypothetical protein